MKQADRIFRIIYREVLWKCLSQSELNIYELKIDLSDKKFRDDISNEYLRYYPYNYTKDEVLIIIQNLCELLGKNKNPLFLFLNYSKLLLTMKNEQLYVKFEDLFEWDGFVSKVDGEAFIAAAYVEYGKNVSEQLHSTKVFHDDKTIYSALKGGVYDNHMHLKASGDSWEMNWKKLFGTCETYKALKILENNVNASAYLGLNTVTYLRIRVIRGYLLSILLKENFREVPIKREEIEQLISTQYEWKLLAGMWKIDYIYILAEFNLDIKSENNLFRELFYLLKQNCLSTRECNILNLYLSARSTIKFKFVQDNIGVGFDRFKSCETIKEFAIEDSEPELLKSVLKNYYLEECVKGVEVRIAPKPKMEIFNISNRLVEINNEIYNETKKKKPLSQVEKIKIGIVVHYIKQSDNGEVFFECRNSRLRESLEKDAEKLNKYFESLKYVKDISQEIVVVGIDAANVEIGCSPEVFAPIFRKHRAEIATHYNLGFTFHVGEEYLSISSGLRSIDEVIQFMDFKKGDRLGHAIALGINVDKYITYKRKRIVTTLQGYVDDLAWMYYMLSEDGIEDMKVLFWLEKEFLNYVSKLYYATGKNYLSLNQYILSYFLRGDVPEMYLSKNHKYLHEHDKAYYCNLGNKNRKRAIVQEIAIEGYLDYHYNSRLKQNGAKVIDVEAHYYYIQSVKLVQRVLHRKIYRKGISIETNPTSNKKIGSIEKYEELPLLRFNKFKLQDFRELENIVVSINTDDSAIFQTSISLEYSYVALALIKNGYPKEKVLEYIEYIQECGANTTFL